MTSSKTTPSCRPERSLRSARRLDEVRASAEAATLTQATRARLIAALDAAESVANAWPLGSITFAAFARELADTYKLARDDAPDADWRTVEPDVLHDLRSRVVAHRYQMELVRAVVAEVRPTVGCGGATPARPARRVPGPFRDAGLHRAAPPLAPWRARLTPVIATRRAAHAKAAQRIAGRLFAERPRAFRKRMEALWKSGKR